MCRLLAIWQDGERDRGHAIRRSETLGDSIHYLCECAYEYRNKLRIGARTLKERIESPTVFGRRMA